MQADGLAQNMIRIEGPTEYGSEVPIYLLGSFVFLLKFRLYNFFVCMNPNTASLLVMLQDLNLVTLMCG